MPKIIQGAKEKILINARKRLFEKGYQHISLRDIASESGIATGTIYNYFDNKNSLITYLMLEDWNRTLETMTEHANGAATVLEGVEKMCDAMEAFNRLYISIWKQPAVAAAASSNIREGHRMLWSQIEEKIILLLEHLGKETRFSAVVAEMVLITVTQDMMREKVLELVAYLYPEP